MIYVAGRKDNNLNTIEIQSIKVMNLKHDIILIIINNEILNIKVLQLTRKKMF